MKTVVLLSLFLTGAIALPGAVVYDKGIAAEECTTDVCTLEIGCRCSSANSPLPPDEVVPQLISLTVDEAVTDDLFTTYWEPLLVGRQNPDGRKIGATFFVPHEYTNYERVNELYNYGFEIGVNSISRNNLQEYWRSASEEVLEQEFGGQRKILSKFANIPIEDIVGARTPQLQLAGNTTFDAYTDVGISYDSSWSTSYVLPLYPYTLNYRSTQACNLGFRCPNESFDGFWILPINDLSGRGLECNNLAACEFDRNNLQEYWRGASEELLEQEFGGQMKILSKFANVAIEDIVGARTPQLQLAGNITFDAYTDVGLSYDSSWSTSSRLPLYPYTLNYRSTQACNLGFQCPNEAFDGFWILPINDLNGKDLECNTLASCGIDGTADEIADWLLDEVNKVRQSTRVPLTFLLESQWFDTVTNSVRGFIKFLDTIAEYDDIFLVSQKQVLDWSKNPVPLSSFQTAVADRRAACTEYNCSYKNDDDERYMTTCVPCPSSYPWLGNPDGDEE